MRLIDADLIKAELQEKYCKIRLNCRECFDMFGKDVCDIIDEQPTAYDVDKVINELENKMFSAELYGDEWDGQTVNNLLCMGDVYEIVKGGGIDE